jgi:hypothetical protein
MDSKPELIPVSSSNIMAIGHDGPNKELHIQFQGGRLYIYSGVSVEMHQQLMAAESVGKHYHAHIKNKFPHKQPIEGESK